MCIRAAVIRYRFYYLYRTGPAKLRSSNRFTGSKNIVLDSYVLDSTDLTGNVALVFHSHLFVHFIVLVALELIILLTGDDVTEAIVAVL